MRSGFASFVIAISVCLAAIAADPGATGDDSGAVREMDKPADKWAPADYLGKWENDTEYCLLSIEGDMVSMTSDRESFSSSFQYTAEGLDVWTKGMLRPAPDAGLTMEGVKGVFYRAERGKGVERFAAFKPYLGVWKNPVTGVELDIQNGGYAYSVPATGGMGFGSAFVDPDGRLNISGVTGAIDPDTGALVVDGVFEVSGTYER